MRQDPAASPSSRRVITFEALPHTAGALELAVWGAYSRAAWLPLLGAVAWTTWSMVARRLRRTDLVAIGSDEVVALLDIADHEIEPALDKLVRYDLARPIADDAWRVERRCPPLPDRLLAAADWSATVLHRRLFEVMACVQRCEAVASGRRTTQFAPRALRLPSSSVPREDRPREV